jgi:hypothetical protein
MLKSLSQATSADGSAAMNSANIAEGFVLTAAAMDKTLDERKEQIVSELEAVSDDNVDRVAADLKRVILTVHVPRDVEHAVSEAFDQLQKPILMRLSPIAAVKNPLKPTIVLSIEDKKSALDALRMLYAEMFTADNLRVDTETAAAIIMQNMPLAASTYRVISTEQHTIVEAQQGFGAWVGFGESDRFLFNSGELKTSEHGTALGIFGKELKQKPRLAISENEASEMYAYCKTLFPKNPLLLARLSDKSFVCLGCSTSL